MPSVDLHLVVWFGTDLLCRTPNRSDAVACCHEFTVAKRAVCWGKRQTWKKGHLQHHFSTTGCYSADLHRAAPGLVQPEGLGSWETVPLRQDPFRNTNCYMSVAQKTGTKMAPW